MLKISFKIKSNVLFKCSNARLLKIYKNFFYTLCFSALSLKKKEKRLIRVNLLLKRNLRSNLIVLMRSPFHYKVSKTLLSQPTQYLKIEFFFKISCSKTLFGLNDLNSIVRVINNSNTFVVDKIKINDLC